MKTVEYFTDGGVSLSSVKHKSDSVDASSPAYIYENLKSNGFAQFDASAFIRRCNLWHEWEAFIQSCWALPPDPYCRERNRFRRMARFLFVPGRGICDVAEPVWDDDLGEWCTIYEQSKAYNAEDGDKKRRFAAFTPVQAWNRALFALMQFDFNCLPKGRFNQAMGVQVNAHINKLVGFPGIPANVSPGHFHRDGEMFTFAHLIDTHNADGGETYVAEAHCAGREFDDVAPSEILAGFCLRSPLASYVVDDGMVSHHLQPVSACPGKKCGSRTVLLVDFTPLVPSLSG